MIAFNTHRTHMTKPQPPSPNALATSVWSLWIDAVGGFQILEGARFSIGGLCTDDPADIGVRSPWRRRVAVLEKSGDDCWLRNEPISSDFESTAIAIANHTLLPIETGHLQAPKIRLDRPSPLSGTLVLRLDPPHRFAAPVDAVLIAGATILIGSSQSDHIRVARMTTSGIVLFKRGPQWMLKGSNGVSQPLVRGQQVEVDDVVMTLRGGNHEKT